MKKNLFPVVVDSVKEIDGFYNTRCLYYRIEFTDNFFLISQDIEQELSGKQFIMGTWAILAHPIIDGIQDTKMTFSSTELIESTFDGLESSKRLSLEFGHIWIPNKTITQSFELVSFKDGDVFRITKEFFSICYRYSANLISEKEWLSELSDSIDAIVFSENETKSFRSWRKEQIEKSKHRYRSIEYEGKRLKKK